MGLGLIVNPDGSKWWRFRYRCGLKPTIFKGNETCKRIRQWCGKVWRHVAFEYPAQARRSMDAFVSRAADALDRSAEDGCDPPATSSR